MVRNNAAAVMRTSRTEVTGMPSRSRSMRSFFSATISPVERCRACYSMPQGQWSNRRVDEERRREQFALRLRFG